MIISTLREACHIPGELAFSTKNALALELLNRALGSGLFHAQWIGCDAAYGNDHDFYGQPKATGRGMVFRSN
ncbi:transposase [Robinsoniella peoriensis]|uniref:transposase n=1 Tax=Robinsoniella peoriensis TaxID=180332 RepID=UPI0010FB962A|nr:transposase [Robinsoniella peoriensis]MDU7028431.1 hypothetical protein [Clostridiales bacterium]